VFYFGNAVAETGDSTEHARVDANDILQTRHNPHPFSNPATITCAYDFDRDQRVDANDILIARNSQTPYFAELELISVPFTTATKSPAVKEDPPPPAESPDLGKHTTGSTPASATDAVLERADYRQQQPLSARLHWLYQFHQPDTQQQPSRKEQAIKVLDHLLATYRPA
jgi:hypothetical protein